MDDLGHGIYTPMDISLLPPLYLIYAENPSDSGKVVSNPSFIFHPIFIVVFIFSYVLYKVLIYKNALYELPFSSDVVTHVFKNLICAWGSLYVRERGSNSFSSVLEKFHILHFACVTLFPPSVWMGAIVLIFKLGLMSCHQFIFQKRDL